MRRKRFEYKTEEGVGEGSTWLDFSRLVFVILSDVDQNHPFERADRRSEVVGVVQLFEMNIQAMTPMNDFG